MLYYLYITLYTYIDYLYIYNLEKDDWFVRADQSGHA